jgi:hypothetical protein
LRQEFSVRPKWGPAIAESDCSSWPIWTTPCADDTGTRTKRYSQGGTALSMQTSVWRMPSDIAKRGGSQAPEKRQAGGHTVNLEDQAEHWMTPRVAMGGYTRDRGDPEAERPTLEGQANAWATPQARDHFPAHTPERIAAMKALGHGMRNLNDEAASWATPRAEDSESAGMRHGRGVADTLTAQTSIWPTPMANEGRLGYQQRPEDKVGSQQSLSTIAMDWAGPSPFSLPAPPIPAGATSSPPSRRLNPRFVEWLMGWPIGWSDCAQPETGLSRWLLHSRGVLSTLVSPPPSAVDQGSLF